jgi:hypothetical protein
MNARPKLRVVKTAPSNVDQILDKLSAEFLACRDWGHSWRAYTVRVDKRRREFEETLRCERCETRKHRLLNKFAEILKTSYTYPAGYLIPGWGRMTKDDRSVLRLRMLGIMLLDNEIQKMDVVVS